MNFKPIIIVAGEPNSIFLEIFFKSLKLKKFSSPLVLIASHNLLILQMEKLGYKKKIKLLNSKNLNSYKLNNKCINLIDVNYNSKKPFEKISSKSNQYIEKSFSIAFNIMKEGVTDKFINGPISKKYFLKNKYPGMTEFISEKFSIKNNAMLIYNKKLSVSPVTTHLPIKEVSNKIHKKVI